MSALAPQYTLVCLEDDQDLARLIRLALAPWPVVVYTAHDGLAGLDLIRAHCPDLILLDLGLPGLNGWDICAALRRDPALHQIPIIVLTAIPSPPRGDGAALDEQIAVYKVKPFTLGELRHMVCDLLPTLCSPH